MVLRYLFCTSNRVVRELLACANHEACGLRFMFMDERMTVCTLSW